MILCAVKNWRVGALVYHTKSNKKLRKNELKVNLWAWWLRSSLIICDRWSVVGGIEDCILFLIPSHDVFRGDSLGLVPLMLETNYNIVAVVQYGCLYLWIVSWARSILQRSYHGPLRLESQRRSSDAIWAIHRPSADHGEGNDIIFIYLVLKHDLISLHLLWMWRRSSESASVKCRYGFYCKLKWSIYLFYFAYVH